MNVCVDGCSEQASAIHILYHKLTLAEELFDRFMFDESWCKLRDVIKCVSYLPFNLQSRAYELQDDLEDIFEGEWYE